jgi:hypothetical protein
MVGVEHIAQHAGVNVGGEHLTDHPGGALVSHLGRLLKAGEATPAALETFGAGEPAHAATV